MKERFVFVIRRSREPPRACCISSGVTLFDVLQQGPTLIDCCGNNVIFALANLSFNLRQTCLSPTLNHEISFFTIWRMSGARAPVATSHSSVWDWTSFSPCSNLVTPAMPLWFVPLSPVKISNQTCWSRLLGLAHQIALIFH